MHSVRYTNPDRFPFVIPIGLLNGMLAGYLIAIVRGRPRGKRITHVAAGALTGMIANTINGIRVRNWAENNPRAEITTYSPTWRFVARAAQQAELAQRQLESEVA